MNIIDPLRHRRDGSILLTMLGLLFLSIGLVISIVALSSTPATLRRLDLLRGVQPLEIAHRAELEDQLAHADAFLLGAGWAQVGDVVVTVGAMPLGAGRETNTIRFHRVRAPGSKTTIPPAPR